MSFRVPTCTLCRDLGILELMQANLKTLAKCWCSAGKNLPNSVWALPTIPVDGFSQAPIEPWLFKPTPEMNYNEKIIWWRERVKTAEEFWGSIEQA